MVYLTIGCLFLFNFFSCGGGGGDDPAPCTPSTGSEATSVNGFDRNPNSQFYNKAVANFTFNQAKTTYSNNCQISSYGSTSLSITNATNKTMSFDYGITFIRNAVTWQYQNLAVIPPKSSINVGVINGGATQINGGNITIVSSSITYQ